MLEAKPPTTMTLAAAPSEANGPAEIDLDSETASETDDAPMFDDSDGSF